ncbi:MAG: hypothetical protein KA149_08510 [Chitinophagales bacterium]|nr:hypothetical protein [Chitinophagales bacterium]
MKLLILMLMPAMLLAQKPIKTFEKITPKFTAQAGFCIPEFYNLGYELNANYYPVSKKWVRLGPAVQLNNFYIVEKEWFPSNNVAKGRQSELRLNALFNVEFIPFKKSSFYVGLAPYIGYQMLNNRGRVTNEKIDLDVKWNYTINTFDYGTRFKLGGFFGKQQRYGLETDLQMSNRGLTDKNPLTKFFNVGLPSYKAYVALNFVYRIK